MNAKAAINVNTFCTYATTDELEWLGRWAASHPNPEGEVVMIGAGPGVMALALLEEVGEWVLTVVEKDGAEYLRAHLNLANLDLRRVRLIFGDSKHVKWVGSPISFLILDGDHTYEGVKGDLLNWAVFVSPGGLIFLHDYNADGTIFENVERYPGVRKAAEELLVGWEQIDRVGTSMVYRRPA